MVINGSDHPMGLGKGVVCRAEGSPSPAGFGDISHGDSCSAGLAHRSSTQEPELPEEHQCQVLAGFGWDPRAGQTSLLPAKGVMIWAMKSSPNAAQGLSPLCPSSIGWERIPSWLFCNKHLLFLSMLLALSAFKTYIPLSALTH